MHSSASLQTELSGLQQQQNCSYGTGVQIVSSGAACDAHSARHKSYLGRASEHAGPGRPVSRTGRRRARPNAMPLLQFVTSDLAKHLQTPPTSTPLQRCAACAHLGCTAGHHTADTSESIPAAPCPLTDPRTGCSYLSTGVGFSLPFLQN